MPLKSGFIFGLGATIGALLITALLLCQSARAESPGRSAVCTWEIDRTDAKPMAQGETEGIQAWMNIQLAAGKTDFFSIPGSKTGLLVVCAY